MKKFAPIFQTNIINLSSRTFGMKFNLISTKAILKHKYFCILTIRNVSGNTIKNFKFCGNRGENVM